MSGLQLGEMELSEMLDVIHVLFEEDFTSALNAEQVDAKIRVRKVIYKEFYNKKYKSGFSDSDSYVDEETIDPAVDYSDIKPFDPKAAARKPYVPPTEFNPDSPKPFGKVLDAPLG